VFRRLDRDMLDAKRGAWAETRLRGLPSPTGGEDAVAMDGKTLRGRQKQGAPGAPLRSALAHRLGLTLAQQAVTDRTNEMPVALALLRPVVLEGREVPLEALRTQRARAQQLVAAGGASVMVAKANPPQLQEDIATVFALPPIVGETRMGAETGDSGHGRIEQRRLHTRDGRVGSSDWPGLAQVFQRDRQVLRKKTGERRAGGRSHQASAGAR
jgi:hypothetical protein